MRSALRLAPYAQPEFVTIPVASKILGIGVKQLRWACHHGEVPKFRLQVGGWSRVRLEDARRWIEAQRVPATSHAKEIVDDILRREALRSR